MKHDSAQDSASVVATRLAALFLFTVMLTACEPAAPPAEQPPETPSMTHSPADPPVAAWIEQQAIADLSQRLDTPEARIRVVSRRAVTWSDGALGCPAPDAFYTQALVPGFQIILAVGDSEYHYHGPTHGRAFLCPDDRRQAPLDDRLESPSR